MSKGARLPEGSPYVGLLKEDEAFLRWYLNVRRGSENTAAGYLRKMVTSARNTESTPRTWRS